MTPQTARWNFRALLCTVAAVGAALALGGCAQRQPQTLTPDSFVGPREVQDRSRVQPVDQPGPLVYEGSPPPAPVAAGVRPPAEAANSDSGVSPTVEQSVRPVREEGFQVPDAAAGAATDAEDDGAPPEPRNTPGATTRGAPGAGPVEGAASSAGADSSPGAPPSAGADQRAGDGATAGPVGSPDAVAPAAAQRTVATTRPAATDSSGGYQLVGTVLADVNSAPVFADKVLGVLDKALAASARQLDERPFRKKAAELIMRQVTEYISNELEFAMAKSRLEERDQQLAAAAATRWREEQITKAGGSPEVAKQQFAARGLDFEEQVEDQYRTLMVQLFYQRKEYPKIQVTAEDKRRYYQTHLAREFSQPDAARFRVILIDPAKRGGRREALGEINRLLDRARSGGADFAALASSAETNDNPSFRSPAGWIARGSFVLPEVERAVWSLKPGQVSDVIETPDGFYLARLEAFQPGKTLPFSDPAVQQRIENILRKRQFDALRLKAQQKLIRDAIIRYHPDEEGMLRTAVEMAAQKYKYWRTADAKTPG
jgi:parvulin-like peptidyl-prolyl isomerase